MAETLMDQYDLSYNPDFQRRMQMAVVSVARSIQAEDPEGLITPPGVKDTNPKQVLFLKRSALAYKVLYEPERYAKLFAQAAAVNPAMGDKADDQAFIDEVRASWNAFSLGAP